MSAHTTRRFRAATMLAVLVAGSLAPGQTLNEDRKLLAGDGAAFDAFGISIAVNSGVVVVGAWHDDDRGSDAGSAYLFNAATGTQIAKLLAGDGAAGDNFGLSVAISNGIVVVGARENDDLGNGSGSAYLFSAATGAEIIKLLPDDGTPGDYFGNAVAISGSIVAVGAPYDSAGGSGSGSVYLFSAPSGTQIAKLTPSDGASNDQFGYTVAIDNGIVAVGAWKDTDNGFDAGSAYLFDTSGAELRKLLPDDGAGGDTFGWSVAIDDGVVAVGAYGDDDNGSSSGSVYLFEVSDGAQRFKLLPSDGASNDWFGWSVGISGGVVGVGSPFDGDNGGSSGSAYTFDAITGTQTAKLLPSDGAAGDFFGTCVAMTTGLACVGGDRDDSRGIDSGAAYLFTTATPCPADLNGDGELNFFDVQAFLTAFAAQDQDADLVDDDIFDFFDVLAFLQAFSAGCP